MITISLNEIEKDLHEYLKRAEEGETVVIVRNNKPVVQIEPVQNKEKKLRPYGLYKGKFVVPDDFDAPLPETIR
ncbi:MAG TPA: type II toxin-antitoxin system prevent-host-death family antitoxin [Chloroflexi bacterium]|nr:type II toxin-antitoxin system prevent-host-death family antitoxin [Chloroflexota bacterium]